MVTVHLVVQARARKSRGFEGSGAGNSRGKACRRSSVVPVTLLSFLVILLPQFIAIILKLVDRIGNNIFGFYTDVIMSSGPLEFV